MMFDKHLFQTNLYYLWKKIINVVFIHKYEDSNQFELYSSTFPIQNSEQLSTPSLVDIWRSGKFMQVTSQYAFLQSFILKMIIFLVSNNYLFEIFPNKLF